MQKKEARPLLNGHASPTILHYEKKTYFFLILHAFPRRHRRVHKPHRDR